MHSVRSTARLVGSLVLLAWLIWTPGCTPAVPGARSRAEVAPEIREIYQASSQRYLEEFQGQLQVARDSRGIREAREALAAAWAALDSAWARQTLAGDVPGLCRVVEAAMQADVGEIPGARADALSRFTAMMKRLRTADGALHRSSEFVEFRELLHAWATGPDSRVDLDSLERSFAIESELWELDGRNLESPHYRALVQMVRDAELAESLRGNVPYKWSQQAQATLRRARAPR